MLGHLVNLPASLASRPIPCSVAPWRPSTDFSGPSRCSSTVVSSRSPGLGSGPCSSACWLIEHRRADLAARRRALGRRPTGVGSLNVLQSYVSQLRKVLGRDAIETSGKGYLARIRSDALDLTRFERSAHAGSLALAEERYEDASAALGDALALWRGPALADLVDEPAVAPIAGRLEELRALALERRIEAEIARGRLCRNRRRGRRPRPRAPPARSAPLAPHGRPLPERQAGRGARVLPPCPRPPRRRARPRARPGAPGARASDPSPGRLAGDDRLRDARDRRAPPPCGRSSSPSCPQARSNSLHASARRSPSVLHASSCSCGRCPTPASSPMSARRSAPFARSCAKRASTRRGAAFTSLVPGADLGRVATEQDADLVLVDAPDQLLEDGRLLALLGHAPCDVGIVVGSLAGPGDVLVPFVGGEHDWAAVELGAWLARAFDAQLLLAGASVGDTDATPAGSWQMRRSRCSGRSGSRPSRCSSRPSRTRSCGPRRGPPSSASACPTAGIATGSGPTRTAIATRSDGPTILVRRGVRPGGLAPRGADTRYTWTIAG